jgi:LuxR family transcriptional regulator, maltose regulon positive regulatory protein
VLRERNQLQHAEACLTEALTVCQQCNARNETVEVICELIRVMIAQTRHEEALEQLRRLCCLDRDEPLPERLHRKLQRTELACRLAIRDIHGARLAIQSLPPSWHPEIVGRLELLAGQPDRAERTLRAVRESHSPLRARIERLVLLARAELLLGREDRAHGTLQRALELGRPDRYIHVFVDDAPALATLLLDIAGDHPDPYLADVAAVAQKTQPASSRTRTAPVGQLVQPITQREREVLSLLPSHLTQRRIGTTLYLSHNTVKSHTKALYRKLGVATRSEAIQAAKYHGLL